LKAPRGQSKQTERLKKELILYISKETHSFEVLGFVETIRNCLMLSYPLLLTLSSSGESDYLIHSTPLTYSKFQ